jgi:recombination protein RecT
MQNKDGNKRTESGGNRLMEKKETAVMAKPEKTEQSDSQRFTEMVLREYNVLSTGDLSLTDAQRELVQHYFIKTDAVLKKAEQDRQDKNKWADYKNELPMIWKNVNLDDMALAVVHHAKLGLDPTMKNHLNIIPYKNTKAQKYDMTFMIGYEGKKFVSLTLALEQPTGLVYDLVYSNDVFKPHMKGPANQVESYEMDIPNPFDRGDIVGGFFYAMYEDPTKNKLTLMSMKDILKRKPKTAAAEFWGGPKKVKGADGKYTEEILPGWLDEMALKTVVRHGCDQIALDPRKVNSDLLFVQQHEVEQEARRVDDDIEQNANGPIIDIPAEPADVSDMQPVSADGQQASFVGQKGYAK